jgi:glyoxylase-like metal-dependent hydrolase (beta-lactamase superfamily II)
LITRREWLHGITVLGGTALAGGALWGCGSTEAPPPAEETSAAATAPSDDPLEAQRAQMAAAPIETLELAPGLVMLSGPGGNVVVLHGSDGKIVVDTFVQPVYSQLNAVIQGLGPGAVTSVVNTHWHFDHSDNNARFRQAGARIVAHENTARRLSESHELLGMQIAPAPEEARPTETFAQTESMQANGETLELAYIPPAHTDTDISIRYRKANVLHCGDVFFNGIYPFIDADTGGSINGMITGVERLLSLADNQTRIVPGHGAIADRAALSRYGDMLAIVRDRVQNLKRSGRSLEQVQSERPTLDLDDAWGKGFMTPDNFVALVYETI